MNPSVPDARPTIHVRLPGQPSTREFTHSILIGSDSKNDVVVEDPSTSQQHIEVTCEDGRWFIRDLDSKNGTYVDGKSIQRCQLRGSVHVRLGLAGPLIELTVGDGRGPVRETVAVMPRDTQVLDRLLGDDAPENMSRNTQLLRRVLRKDRSRLVRRYVVALTAIGAVAVTAILVVYSQRKQLERLRLAAADVFYAMKSLELEVSKLSLDSVAQHEYSNQQEQLRQTYLTYLQELGVYGEDTPEDERLIYRVIHRFGESEVTVPDEFVAEVKRHIDRWRNSGRLAAAMNRARENGFARSITGILLEHNMPPEFLYVAVQESGLQVEAVGRETRYGIAKGMWQLMPETARAYGLRIGPLVGVPRFDPEDDRHRLEESTRVAARHLRFIYTTDAQASGLMVMASYNWGHGNVVPLIQAMPENPRERNFWTLLDRHRDRIPSETYNYVFNIVSAAVVGENPALFGFDFEPLALRPSVSDSTDSRAVVAGPSL